MSNAERKPHLLLAGRSGGDGPLVKDYHDLREIQEINLTDCQIIAATDQNVHVVLIHPKGELRFKVDPKSAKALALNLTLSALKLEPEEPNWAPT